jgi:pimeloyl-ACP methyl ester carboxylesterase
MDKIFLIPGLGADSRIYKNIHVNGYNTVPVDWVEPAETDTLRSYSQKLILQYNITPKSIVIGNSMGGMIAVEIAKAIPLEKVILISSIDSVNEAPGYFRFFRSFPVYKAIPAHLFTAMAFLIEPMFGKMKREDKALFRDMLSKSSPTFVKWAMGAILAWDNRVVPINTYQVAGDRDLVFPHKKIKDAIIVKGGTHIMIFDKAKEINQILKDILTQ